MNNENKKRYAFNMTPSKDNKIKTAMILSGTKNRSHFINEAIDFYISYLYAEQSVDCLSPIINRSLKNVIAGTEKNMCEMLFKLAVEMGVLTDILSGEYDFSQEQIDEIRKHIAQSVAETNGIIKFGDEDNS